MTARPTPALRDYGEYANMKPLPDTPKRENMQETPHIDELHFMLLNLYRHDPAVFLNRDTSYIQKDRQPSRIRRRPDCVVVFGVDRDEVWKDNGYVIDKFNQPVNFVLEVASESTHQRDSNEKARDYAEMGVLEYWRLDPTNGSLMDPPLAANRLAGGRYERIGLNTETSGMIWSHSDQLGLDLCWDGNQLRIYNPAAREYLKNRAEEQTARQAAEDARQQEQAARQAAEARVAELEEELERGRQP
jgi:Uma2 family endonuclease